MMSSAFTCLAIETATAVTSVAVCNGEQLSIRQDGTARAQSRRIYELVRDALAESALTLGELDCVAFGCGPGSFTSLRVGAAAAQALAFGSSLPVCRVSSLEILAQGAARAHGAKAVAACLDARMGEAYFGLYVADEAGVLEAEISDRLVDPAGFVLDARDTVFAAGPGWAAYPDLYQRNKSGLSGADPGRLPLAEDLLRLARRRFESGETIAPEAALPNYVRDQVTG